MSYTRRDLHCYHEPTEQPALSPRPGQIHDLSMQRNVPRSVPISPEDAYTPRFLPAVRLDGSDVFDQQSTHNTSSHYEVPRRKRPTMDNSTTPTGTVDGDGWRETAGSEFDILLGDLSRLALNEANPSLDGSQEYETDDNAREGQQDGSDRRSKPSQKEPRREKQSSLDADSNSKSGLADRKRRRCDKDEDNYNDDQDGDDTGSGDGGIVGHGSDVNNAQQRLPCLYWMHNPYKHHDCSTKSFWGISEMRQHLRRKHKRPDNCCSRCYLTFPSDAAKVAHDRTNQCTARDYHPFRDRFDEDRWGAIQKRVRGRSLTSVWKSQYEVLFPGEHVPVAPVIDDERDLGSVAHLIDILKAYPGVAQDLQAQFGNENCSKPHLACTTRAVLEKALAMLPPQEQNNDPDAVSSSTAEAPSLPELMRITMTPESELHGSNDSRQERFTTFSSQSLSSGFMEKRPEHIETRMEQFAGSDHTIFWADESNAMTPEEDRYLLESETSILPYLLTEQFPHMASMLPSHKVQVAASLADFPTYHWDNANSLYYSEDFKSAPQGNQAAPPYCHGALSGEQLSSTYDVNGTASLPGTRTSLAPNKNDLNNGEPHPQGHLDNIRDGFESHPEISLRSLVPPETFDPVRQKLPSLPTTNRRVPQKPISGPQSGYTFVSGKRAIQMHSGSVQEQLVSIPRDQLQNTQHHESFPFTMRPGT